ncbi:MAG: SUMF1/EgtB/PvdO family nonheme iron enzyme [Saprospiraceae bacterium]|nr:SUMF1/EgtB/PvdO family nonheme iron enzyme [Saprospiraceae bacterium]
MPEPLKTFIIYARADEAHKKELLQQLRPLLNARAISVWHDGDIQPGEHWEARILQELKASQLILMLVSPASLNSEFIQEQEFRLALEKARSGAATVVPIIVEHCAWTWDPVLSQLQALPAYEGQGIRPVTDRVWQSPKEAWATVTNAIGHLVAKGRSNNNNSSSSSGRSGGQEMVKASKPLPSRSAWIGGLGLGSLLVCWILFKTCGFPGAAPAPEDAGMVLVRGGTFQMGSTEGEDNEKPLRAVTLSDFYLGKFEVTVAEFKAFVEDSHYQTDAEKGDSSWGYEGTEWKKIKGRNWRHDPEGNPAPGNHPVANVSWNDATAYCQWLSKKTGEEYRLPTEAEWEYAAGNGSRHSRYSWGDGPPSGKKGGNLADESGATRFKWTKDATTIFVGYNDGYAATAPVGSFEANELGLFDMTGNVWEWCADWYDTYPTSSQPNPSGPASGSGRVLRGGSWSDYPQFCRVAFRNGFTPGVRGYDAGFRLARTK